MGALPHHHADRADRVHLVLGVHQRRVAQPLRHRRAEDPWCAHHEIGLRALRLLLELDDAATVEAHHAEVLRVRHAPEHEPGVRARREHLLDERAHRPQHDAVDGMDDRGPFEDLWPGGEHRVAVASGLGLNGPAQLQAAARCRRGSLERLVVVGADDDGDVAHADLAHEVHRVVDQRSVEDRDQRLRELQRKRSQARGGAGGQDHAKRIGRSGLGTLHRRPPRQARRYTRPVEAWRPVRSPAEAGCGRSGQR